MNVDPAEFFQAAHEIFLSAGRTFTHHYSFGGRIVRLQIASAEMHARLIRAFTHLSAPAGDVDLTICAWDSGHTGAKMISPPWRESDYGPRGEIRGFNTERFRAAFDHGTNALSIFDRERKLALFWTRDARRLPAYEMGAPFRAILSWWAETNDLVLVHAGAVGNEHGAMLLAGAGGAGKSTTALLCLQAGWHYLADDYCLLQIGKPGRVFSLYSSAKLRHNHLPGFSKLGIPAAMDGDKQMFFLNEIFPAQMTQSLECRALFLPRISVGRASSIEPASAGDALRALAPSSIFQVSGAGAVAFQRLSEFVRTVPVRWANLGSDLSQIPKSLGDALATI